MFYSNIKALYIQHIQGFLLQRNCAAALLKNDLGYYVLNLSFILNDSFQDRS